MTENLIVVAHIVANLLWIGSIAAVGWLLVRAHGAKDDATGTTIAVQARDLYRSVASPAFFASFTAVVVRVLLNPSAYMKAHWFHGKLTFAIAVIGLHHVLGAKAKKAADGGRQNVGTSGILTLSTVICATVVAVFAVLKLPS